MQGRALACFVSWAHREAVVHYERIRANVLRAQRSIVMSLVRETLERGAELIPLPGYSTAPAGAAKTAPPALSR